MDAEVQKMESVIKAIDSLQNLFHTLSRIMIPIGRSLAENPQFVHNRQHLGIFIELDWWDRLRNEFTELVLYLTNQRDLRKKYIEEMWKLHRELDEALRVVRPWNASVRTVHYGHVFFFSHEDMHDIDNRIKNVKQQISQVEAEMRKNQKLTNYSIPILDRYKTDLLVFEQRKATLIDEKILGMIGYMGHSVNSLREDIEHLMKEGVIFQQEILERIGNLLDLIHVMISEILHKIVDDKKYHQRLESKMDDLLIDKYIEATNPKKIARLQREIQSDVKELKEQ